MTSSMNCVRCATGHGPGRKRLSCRSSRNTRGRSKKQFPLLFTVAVTTYVTGIGLMVYSLYSLIKKVEIHRVMGFPAPDVLNGIRLLLDFGIGPAILFVTGLAMVLGSLIGMQDVWKSLLARDPEESE